MRVAHDGQHNSGEHECSVLPLPETLRTPRSDSSWWPQPRCEALQRENLHMAILMNQIDPKHIQISTNFNFDDIQFVSCDTGHCLSPDLIGAVQIDLCTRGASFGSTFPCALGAGNSSLDAMLVRTPHPCRFAVNSCCNSVDEYSIANEDGKLMNIQKLT